MRARLARLAFLSAVLVVAACIAGYLLSTPTDAAPSAPLPRVSWQQQEEELPVEPQGGVDARERPTQRPQRSDYDDPGRRVRDSYVEALLQRNEAGTRH
jgi:hypothetical protein